MRLIYTDYGPCAFDPNLPGIEWPLYSEYDEYKDHFRYLRQIRKLNKLLKQELGLTRGRRLGLARRKLPWLEDFKNLVAAFGKEPDRIHRKMYLDALRRAESTASEKTPIS